MRSIILSNGWKVVLPIVKIIYRIRLHVKCSSHSFFSYLSKFSGYNYVGCNSSIVGSTLGYGSYVADDVFLYNTIIGKYSCIGPRTKIIVGRHPVEGHMPVHPVFYKKCNLTGLDYGFRGNFQENKYVDVEKKTSVIIGSDVWIGADVKILEGVTISDGAVIAACSVVTKDVPAYEIWMGHPAKKYGERVSKEMAIELTKIKWWDWDEKDIKEKMPHFAITQK